MTTRLKYIIGIVTVGIIAVFGFVIFGLYLMAEEDKYGDLVYFNQKVENGDLIFRCEYTGPLGQTTNFNEFGIIEEISGKVYVWDNQNTIKKNLYVWAGEGNGQRVRIFRIKESDFDINKMKLINGTYNYLMDSDKIKFVTENY